LLWTELEKKRAYLHLSGTDGSLLCTHIIPVLSAVCVHHGVRFDLISMFNRSPLNSDVPLHR
jgi:hypothetical protein